MLKIPPELEKEITVLDFNLPTAAQIDARIDEVIHKLDEKGKIEVTLDKRQRGQSGASLPWADDE